MAELAKFVGIEKMIMLRFSFPSCSLLLCSLLILLLNGCKKEPSGDYDQNRIYTDYSISVYESSYRSSIDVEFHLDKKHGKRLYLTGGARLFFNGTEIFERTPEHGNYQLTVDSLVNAGEFVYVNSDGDTFRNPLTVQTIGVPSFYNNLEHGFRNYMYWDGTALNSDERAWMDLYPAYSSSSIKSFDGRVSSANGIEISASEIADVAPGDYDFKLLRSRTNTHINASAAGGSIYAVYETDNWPIRVY